MLRDNFVTLNKPIPATYKAAAAMKTGMGVVIDDANKQVKFPTGATSENVYFVNKERIAQTAGSQANLSDYDDLYTTIASGEFVKIEKYLPGEEFLTDAKGTTATVGKVLAVGTDGLLADATATTVKSALLYVADVKDNGHTLMKIRVLDTPIANTAS